MFEIKSNLFFDKKHVTDRVYQSSIKSLSKFGAYVRTAAMRSIRKRKKVAEAGSPPSSHTGLLRKFIFFYWDQSTESVVIGPALTKSKSTPVPNLLEFGGTVNHWKTGKPAIYRKFPFMEPAYKGELGKFAGLFANTVGD